MGLAFIYPALPTCLVGYVQKSGFNLINVFCEEIVVKNVLCLAQCLLTQWILHPRVYQNFPGVYQLDGVYQLCALQEQPHCPTYVLCSSAVC